VVAAALAAASPATAAPTLTVTPARPSLDTLTDATLAVTLDVAPAAAAARLTVYVPAGTTLRMRRSFGSEVGRVLSGSVDGGSLGPVSVTGTLLAADPGGYVADACAPGAHAGVWVLRLLGSGVDVAIPVLVDEVSDAAERTRGRYRLDACLPAQPRLLGLELVLDDAVRTPARRGTSTWRAVVTPAGPLGVADAALATESRALVPLPVTVTLTGEHDFVSGSAMVEGRVRVAGKAVAGTLALLAGPLRGQLEQDGTVRLDARGRFTARRAIDARTFFRVEGELPAADVTAAECDRPVAAAGCVSALHGPVAVRGEALAVPIPPPPTLRLGDAGREVRYLQQRLVELRYLPPGSASGSFDWRTWHAVVAFQGWELQPRDGAVGPAVWRALGDARPPRPFGGAARSVQIDRGRQVALLVEDGAVRRAIHVSTGAAGRTPAGRFSVFRKETLSWSIPFEVWMPWASYFAGGFAMHEYSSVPAYPASHGCVRVPSSESRLVFGFASYGTPVIVR
jgi:hypothetical protein